MMSSVAAQIQSSPSEERLMPRPGVVAGFSFVTAVALIASIISPVVAAYTAAFLPLLTYFITAGAAGRQLGRASVALVCAMSHAIFFGSGLTQFLTDGEQLHFGIVGAVHISDLLSTLFATSFVSSALVAGATLVRPKPRSGPPTVIVARALTWTALAVGALALLGAFTLTVSYGGLTGVSAAFISHDRTAGVDASGSLGATLWGTFGVPAIVLLLQVVITPSSSRPGRYASASLSVVLLAFAIGVLGSRLALLLAVVAVWFAYDKLYARAVRFRYIVAVVATTAVVSPLVLNGRATAQNTVNQASVWEALGYGVFDVTAGLSFVRDSIQSTFASGERAMLAFSTILPGSGSRANLISDARLDVIVARTIGSSAHAESTGLPPSLPTALWVSFGALGAAVLALLLGWALSKLWEWLARGTFGLAFLFGGLFGAFVFNVFKGGDLALDLGSELSRWVYLGLAYLVVSFLLGNWRRQ